MTGPLAANERHRRQVLKALLWVTLVGGLFFVTAVTVAGLPPLSGFVGKLMVLEAAQSAPAAIVIWCVLLVAALVVIVAAARAGSARRRDAPCASTRRPGRRHKRSAPWHAPRRAGGFRSDIARTSDCWP